MANAGTKLWLGNQEALSGDYHILQPTTTTLPIAFGAQNSARKGDSVSENVTPTLDKSKTPAVCFPINTQLGLRGADTSNTSREGIGLGRNGDPSFTLQAAHCHAVAWAIMPMNSGKDYKARQVDVAQPLMAAGPVGGNQGGDYIQQPIGTAVAFDPNQVTSKTPAIAFGVSNSQNLAHCLRSGASKADKPESTTYISQSMTIRRLTPRECERLQGFPDDYTLIQYRNKPAADGPRYKAMGNSMAVPVMRWIGEQIQKVENMMEEK
jgi:hypothetical protein